MNLQTYGALKEEVIQRLGNRTDLASRVDQWAMDALMELTQAPKASFRELDALYEVPALKGKSTLDTPADFWFILSLRDNDRRLDQVHWQVLDRVARTVGWPVRFARFNDRVELDPIPDQDYALTMRYRRRLPKLMVDFPIPIEREWHEILVTLTVSKGLEALQRFEEAAGVKQTVDATIGSRQDNPLLEDDGYETTLGVRLS